MMLARRSLVESSIFCCFIIGILSTDPIYFIQAPENLYLTGLSGIRPNGNLHCVAECADSTYNPVSYTWLYNGEVLSGNTSIRQIYRNGTISILKIHTRVSGWYQCRAMTSKGNWGILTAPVEVKEVVFKNKFTIPPKSRLVPLNNPAIFQCQPYPMTPPAVISWSFNGIPVQTSSIHRVLPHGDLLVQRVNEGSIGKYKCSAMNPVTKQIAKAGAKLTIADDSTRPQRMSLKHRNLTASVGDDVTIDCITLADRLPDRVIWKHNGGRLKLPEKSFQWCLNIGPAQVDHEGLYECEVEFGETSFKVAVNLTVQERPSVKLTPLAIQLNTTHPYRSLTCKSTGHPSPIIHLYHNTKLLTSTPTHKTTLTVTVSESGIYQCTANSIAGWASQTAVVFGFSPVFPTGTKAILSVKGSAVINLTCDALGVPRPDLIYWKRRESLDRSWSILLFDVGGLKLDGNSLVVENVGEGDSGLYMCAVENMYGKEEKIWNVTVTANDSPTASVSPVNTGSPAPQLLTSDSKRDATSPHISPSSSSRGLMLTDTPALTYTNTYTQDAPSFELQHINITSATTARLHWSMNGRYDDIHFDVNYESSDGVVQTIDVSEFKTFVDLTGLVPLTHYHITVIVHVGKYILEDSLSFETLDAKPSLQPRIFQILILSPYTIRVNWSQPSLPRYQPLLGFKVQYQPNSSSIISEKITKQTYIVIKQLRPNTKYQIWVVPYNEYGNGIKSEMRTVTTHSDESQNDLQVSGESDGSTHITSLGIILGVVIGLLGLIVMVMLVVVFLRQRRKSALNQRDQIKAVVSKWEEVQERDKAHYNSEPEGPTPSLGSTCSSPTFEKTNTFLPVTVSLPTNLDDNSDDDDFIPGYSKIGNNSDTEQQRPPASNINSHLYVAQDDGVPDYAKVIEKSKKKYRSRSSLKINSDSLDKGIEVMDYAELDMPPGGPVPVVSTEDKVDYAEIDFCHES